LLYFVAFLPVATATRTNYLNPDFHRMLVNPTLARVYSNKTKVQALVNECLFLKNKGLNFALVYWR